MRSRNFDSDRTFVYHAAVAVNVIEAAPVSSIVWNWSERAPLRKYGHQVDVSIYANYAYCFRLSGSTKNGLTYLRPALRVVLRCRLADWRKKLLSLNPIKYSNVSSYSDIMK